MIELKMNNWQNKQTSKNKITTLTTKEDKICFREMITILVFCVHFVSSIISWIHFAK